MNVRTAKWAGIVITTATITGLIAYFAVVGLNEANELAGPIAAGRSIAVDQLEEVLRST